MCHDIYTLSINFLIMSIDKKSKIIVSKRNLKKKKNNVTNMFENFDKNFVLLTKIYIEINENLTHIVYKTFRFLCKYLFFKLNIFVILFVF